MPLTEHKNISVASDLNVTKKTVAITENVPMGCNIIMWGIDWQAGDHLLVSNCEHSDTGNIPRN